MQKIYSYFHATAHQIPLFFFEKALKCANFAQKSGNVAIILLKLNYMPS